MATLEISKNKGLYFVIPEECGTGVKKVAGKVAKDVEGTLSFCPEICETAVPAKQAVIAVTAGSGKLAETLCSKISKLGQVEGKRESYAFIVAENPVELKAHLLFTEVINLEPFMDCSICQSC